VKSGQRQDADPKEPRIAPLHGPKKAAAWLFGLFFLLLGAAIIAGYQIYWMRVVVPQRNTLAAAISVDASKLDPQNDGKLVHLTGELAGATNLSDPDFGVSVEALRLRRRVWMYQWKQLDRQSKSTYSEVDEKGNSTTLLKTETYNYTKDWFENVIDSRSFYNRGHDNPGAKEISDRAVDAGAIALGGFTLSKELAQQIDNFQPAPMDVKNLSALNGSLRAKASLADGGIYFGTNFNQPAIGDMKVKVEFAPPATASVIARQDGGKLSPYAVPNAGSVALLKVGTFSVAEMTGQFAQANSQARTLAMVAGGVLVLFGSFITMIARKR
jgi:hypothetical protein